MTRPSGLPSETTPATGRGALVLQGLVLLLVLVGLNLGFRAVFQRHPEWDNRTYSSFVAQWNRLVELPEGVETLILGDSSGRHGLHPRVLDEVLDTHSMNFCTMGDAAITNVAWQLAAHLERHTAPRRVVVVNVYDIWERRMELPLVARVPLPWGYWSNMGDDFLLDAAQRRDVFLERYAPVIRQDQTVSQLLLYPWKRRRPINFDARGFAAIGWRDHETVLKDRRAHLWREQNIEWSISPENRRAVRTIAAMANAHGFDVYLVNSPLIEGLLDHPEFGPYYESAQSELDEMFAEYPRLHRIFRDPLVFAVEQMQSADHVLGRWTGEYTRAVAEAIGSRERAGLADDRSPVSDETP